MTPESKRPRTNPADLLKRLLTGLASWERRALRMLADAEDVTPWDELAKHCGRSIEDVREMCPRLQVVTISTSFPDGSVSQKEMPWLMLLASDKGVIMTNRAEANVVAGFLTEMERSTAGAPACSVCGFPIAAGSGSIVAERDIKTSVLRHVACRAPSDGA